VGISALALTFDSSSTDATSYTPASITVPQDTLIIAVVASTVGSGVANVPTVTLPGGTAMTQVDTHVIGTETRRISMFRAVLIAAQTGSPTISFGTQTQIGCEWSFVALNKAVIAGTAAADAIVQSNRITQNAVTGLTVTLSAFGDAAHNVALGGFLHGANEVTNAEAGYTSLGGVSHASPATSFLHAGIIGEDTTVSATWATSIAGVAVAAEVRAAPLPSRLMMGVGV
jgi:hypothetical protein